MARSISGSAAYHLPLELSNGGFAEIGVNTYAEVIEVPFTLNSARNAVVSTGRHEFTRVFRALQRKSGRAGHPCRAVFFGTFYNGYKRSYSVGPSIRPNERLNASLNLHINDIDLPGVSYVSTLATARVNYSFSTDVFLNALSRAATPTRGSSARTSAST